MNIVVVIVVFAALVAFLDWCLLRMAALSERDFPHADPGSPPPGSAFDDVEFVFPPFTPYDGKRRLP